MTNFPQNTTKCRIYERNFFAQYMPHFFKNRCSLNVFCGKFVKNMDDLWEVCQKIWQTSSRSLFLNVLRKCLSPESAPKLAKIGGTAYLVILTNQWWELGAHLDWANKRVFKKSGEERVGMRSVLVVKHWWVIIMDRHEHRKWNRTKKATEHIQTVVNKHG